MNLSEMKQKLLHKSVNATGCFDGFINGNIMGWLAKPFISLNLVLDGDILSNVIESTSRTDVFDALSIEGYGFVFIVDGGDINIELLNKESVIFEVIDEFNEILLSKSYSVSELLSSIMTYKKIPVSDILSVIQESSYWDESYYCRKYSESLVANSPPSLDYIYRGNSPDIWPSEYFFNEYYLKQIKSINTVINPLYDYITSGTMQDAMPSDEGIINVKGNVTEQKIEQIFEDAISTSESTGRLTIEAKGNKSIMEKEVEQLAKQIKLPVIDENVNGSIDHFNAGVVSGWSAAIESDRSINIHIICNEEIIGSGCADLFRGDLKNANIHQGKHAFEIAVKDSWPSEIEELELSLIDADTLQPVAGSIAVIKIPSDAILGQILKEEHGHLITKLASKRPLGKRVVVLYHEDRPLCQVEVDINETEIEVRHPLPLILQDGKRQLFKVGILGEPRIIAMGYFTIYAIKTPWHYIKESHNRPGFMSMSPQADSRYESLDYQLQALAKGKALIDVKDLMVVHQVIVEGYEGRTNFPAFSLPKFQKPEVSIIVPAYNKFELTYHCIATIALAYNKTSYEVILADDCSTDETAEAKKIIKNLVISKNPENLRFLKSCNRASKIAQGDFIIFLNNDTEVSSYWLDELIDKMKSDSNIGMTGSKLLNLDGSLQEAGGIVWGNGQPWNVGRGVNPMTPDYNYAREVDYLTGAAMCIRRDIWQEVGLFSEELAPCYYEDTDLAFKVREAGYKTMYVPHSVVVHFEGKSHGIDVTKGLKRYQVVNEKTFHQKWYKAFRNNGRASVENLNVEKDRNVEQRVLVIDYASPMPNKDAGSYAAIQEMKLIQSLGFKVTFVPANLAHFGKYTTELQKIGIEVLYAPFYHNVNHVLETRLAEMDAVYITRYEIAQDYIPYIRQNSNAKIVFNNADLHFLRQMREALTGGTDQQQLNVAVNTRQKELAVCREVDAILCYTSTEHAVITSHILESEKLHLTPWVLEHKPQGPSFKKRQGIVFLGGFNHSPNGDAVEYLVNDIMPLLANQRPEICLYVYGSNMPVTYKEWESDNIKMVGFAENLDSVYHSHRVFVAPLLSGAGIKGKVLESMAYNLPTVLTDVAAEGTGLTHGISTLIAQSPKEWVDGIVKLYDDQTLWTRFAQNSQTLVEAKYSFEHGHKVFKDIFASVGVYSSNCEKYDG
jgi:GT2 family glycosyltransferase/glycosyltransferase involved in cell wall biosynthesis